MKNLNGRFGRVSNFFASIFAPKTKKFLVKDEIKISDFFTYSESLKKVLYVDGRTIATDVVAYRALEEGIFVKYGDETVRKASFFKNSGEEVAFEQFLFGYKVFWEEKLSKYYSLFANVELDAKAVKLLKKYNNEEDLKGAHDDEHYIYRVGDVYHFLDANLKTLFSSKYRLCRNNDIITCKSEKPGLFFDAFSVSKGIFIETIDINNLDDASSYLIPLTNKIKEDVVKFVNFQGIVPVPDEANGYKLYKWSHVHDFEIYDENMNLLDESKGGFVTIHPQGYLKTQAEQSAFYNFKKELILKKRWQIKVYNGVLSVLQNHGGQFFHEVYNIKDGLYIGRILATFRNGENSISNVEDCNIIEVDGGVQISLDDCRTYFISSDGTEKKLISNVRGTIKLPEDITGKERAVQKTRSRSVNKNTKKKVG